jgi:hypothetical protein
MINLFRIFYTIIHPVHPGTIKTNRKDNPMSKKIKTFGKIFGFIAFVLFVYFFFLPFTPILIAGVISQGILGKVSGKVGPVVGGDWKGINYLRGYVIPANPQTPDQVTQRTRFTVIQDYVRQVLSTLVQPYWDQYQSGQSGYNAIMSDWMLNADGSNLLVAACKASKGTLSPQSIATAVYLTGSGELSLTWVQSLVGNQLATDVVRILVFNKASGILYFKSPSSERSEAGTTVELPTGLTATNLEVFTFFKQGTGSSMIVSDSVHRTATAS